MPSNPSSSSTQKASGSPRWQCPPEPAQDVLFTTDAPSTQRSSTSSSRSSSSTVHSSFDVTPSPPQSSGPQIMESVRCSRCQRTMSNSSGSGSSSAGSAGSGSYGAVLDDWSTNGNGMVRFGHNLYYCARCASMVGLKP